jgi:hypothetical protein
MLLLGLYMLVAYYVEEFAIRGKMVRIRSVFQNGRFHVDELQRLVWRCAPRGGAIHFKLIGSRWRLDLHGFSRDDRLEVIRMLRQAVSLNKQHG